MALMSAQPEQEFQPQELPMRVREPVEIESDYSVHESEGRRSVDLPAKVCFSGQDYQASSDGDLGSDGPPWSSSGGWTQPDDLPAKVTIGAENHDFSSVDITCSELADESAVAGAMPESPCRWHKSAKSVGVISEDGHVFTKVSGSRKLVRSRQGSTVELPSLCMVYDESLRCGGLHKYHYHILDGELGAGDGAGFVFDSVVRRNNIQRMRSVFLNQRGRICLRNHEHISKLGPELPPLTVGMWLMLTIDLDSFCLQFSVYGLDGVLIGYACISFADLFTAAVQTQPCSGFFCAVVTKEVSVGLV